MKITKRSPLTSVATARAHVAAQFSPAMQSALVALERLIAQGVEFPDACWRVARRSGFLVDELRKAYDVVQGARP